MQVFSAVQGHCTAAFYDAITGLTEFISIVNSVKMLNMPAGMTPIPKGGNKSWYIIMFVYS